MQNIKKLRVLVRTEKISNLLRKKVMIDKQLSKKEYSSLVACIFKNSQKETLKMEPTNTPETTTSNATTSNVTATNFSTNVKKSFFEEYKEKQKLKSVLLENEIGLRRGNGKSQFVFGASGASRLAIKEKTLDEYTDEEINEIRE